MKAPRLLALSLSIRLLALSTALAALAATLTPASLLARPVSETGRSTTEPRALEADGKAGDKTGDKADEPQEKAHHTSRLSEERIPLQLEAVPQRPKPLLELGEPFLGTGTLRPGFRLPTGAIWQPSLLVFGTLRTAVQTIDQGDGEISELVARLDLFVNLQLSGTERLVVGLRPLQQNGRFTRQVFSSDIAGTNAGFDDETNLEVTSLFFEGDFGEIFPNLSRNDMRSTDVGFSVGRQPLFFQEGILINDELDGIGLTRNTLQPNGTSNFRATVFWAWNEVGRSRFDTNSNSNINVEDDDAQLLALLTSTDLRRSTLDVDLVYVASDTGGDLFAGGASAVQRIGKINTAFRVLGSAVSGGASGFPARRSATDGVLLFSEVSWTPRRRHDLFYINNFVAFDQFSSAARGPTTGGPLGRAGISFAAVGLGSFGAPLSSVARDVAGGAVGYQRFFKADRSHIIVELGGRVGTEDSVGDSLAAVARYQVAFGRRGVVIVDGFLGRRSKIPSLGVDSANLFGARLELLLKF